MTRHPVVLGWSGGKDSTLALARLREDQVYDIVGLITTVTLMYDRISIHGVRRELLQSQAAALGLEVIEAPLAPAASNAAYEASFLAALAQWRHKVPELTRVAFGDLFLEDIRGYRERLVSQAGCTALFPLWGEPTEPLARRFVEAGYEAHLVCVDTAMLDATFAGRRFDHSLLAELPHTVDHCGERGEFHTFVHAGPIFEGHVAVRPGEIVLRDGCAYADLLPAG